MRLPGEDGFPVLPLKIVDPYGLGKKLRHGRTDWYDDAAVAEQVAAKLELLEAVKPELVLGDFRLTAEISAKLAGIPYASLLTASWTNYLLSV
jgi:hypothetical protein